MNPELLHISKNKNNLIMRSNIIRLIREFFWSENFLEVETPNVLRLPGQEPYLSPMSVEINNEKLEKFTGFLHTSPEYTMKKMLAAGFENIFSICKCYRDVESFGGTHNPEFTMIEWYRANSDFFSIMDDTENLFKFINQKLNFDLEKINLDWERISMKELWQKYVSIDLDNYLNQEKMYELCLEKKYNVKKDEAYEDLFYRIFLNEIEPHLGKERPTIIYNYPAQMAALSKICKNDKRYAERFEVYIEGLELANAFTELNDSEEQLMRLEEEKITRKNLGKIIYDIDKNFIDSLNYMPDSAGIALGVDRLVQVFTNCQNIDDVLVLPSSILFKNVK